MSEWADLKIFDLQLKSMYSLFWIAFAICLIVNLIKSGEAYSLFYRYVNLVNSIQDKSPRDALKRSNRIITEYKFGKRIYAVILKPSPNLGWNCWTQVFIFKEGTLEPPDKTGKIIHYAGPWRTFHFQRITPNDINPKYLKMAFRYDDGNVIQVGRDEIIIEKLGRVRSAYGKLIDPLLAALKPKSE